MIIMIDRFPDKAQAMIKYMHDIRLAASRGNVVGVTYDEQFRAKMKCKSDSSWAHVDQELWVLYVPSPTPKLVTSYNIGKPSAPYSIFSAQNHSANSNFRSQTQSQTYRTFNNG